MRIADVSTHVVKLPFTSGGGRGGPTDWSTLDYVLVRMETDDGHVGWGDGFAYRIAEAPRAVIEQTIGPGLVGRDARDIAGVSRALQVENHLWGRYGITMFAISGIDIALWDILGNQPGAKLPGTSPMKPGRRRNRVQCVDAARQQASDQPRQNVAGPRSCQPRRRKIIDRRIDDHAASRMA